MSHFQRALDLVLKHEGGYSNNPSDPGGETNYGITLVTARRHGYNGSMRDIQMSVVEQIYRESYWNKRFETLPFPVAFNVFDGNVNSGVQRSVMWIQDACGAVDDGIFGPMTQDLVMRADPGELVLGYNSRRLAFLTRLHTWPSFGRGWAARIAANMAVR
jgi:lysozyme family protein